MTKASQARRQNILKMIDQINVWKNKGQRATHKPLLLLYALARLSRGEQGPVYYRDIDRDIRRLLVEFGPPRKSVHPEYPFWRLQNDGLWVVRDADQLTRRKNKDDPKKSELMKYNTAGELPVDIARTLRRDPSLFGEVVSRILDRHFPPSLHDDILDEIGMHDMEIAVRRKRDPVFRKKVLLAYDYRCAVCNFDIHLALQPVGMEAAHIKWHQVNGPDSVDNGLALCATHHKLLDRGAFTLSDARELIVSPLARGEHGLTNYLKQFEQQEIRKPRESEMAPRLEFIKWHRKEVFRDSFR